MTLRNQSFGLRQASVAVVALLLSNSPHICIAQTVLDTAALAFAVEANRSAESQTTSSIGNVEDPAITRPDSLRHLPVSPAGWRVQGDTGGLSWRIYLTSDEAATVRTFRLTYKTAISVLPNASTIEMRVNDVQIDRRGIAVPSERQPVDLAIPASVLRAGFNTITFRVDQLHRVDCSREAAYELWTEIDPAETGFITPVLRPVSRLPDLPALRARADGALVIRVLFKGQMRPQRIDQTIRAAQAIGIASRFDHSLVSFVADPAADTGVNLIVGDPTEIAGLVGASATTPHPANLKLSVRQIAGSRAPTLIVAGATDNEISEAIERIASFAGRESALDAIDEAKQGTAIRVTGGERVRLDAIRMPNTDVTGRQFRLPFALDMPADFLAADYDKLVFALSGKYTGHLTDAANLTIHINGRDAASVPLPRPSKAAFARNDIGVPLGFFRPGRNEIEIVAELPDYNKGLCSATSRAGNRFRLLGTSEIRIPHLARIAQVPALRLVAAGGYPFASAGTVPKLYVPAPDRDALAAAATLAVKLSVAADRLIPFQVVFSNPDITSSEDGLVVAPAQALDPALMRTIGIDPDSVQQSWQQHGSVDAPNTAQRPRKSGADSSWLSRGMAAIRAHISVAAVAPEIDNKASLIVAQGRRTNDNPSITIVTAPDSATLARSVAALVRPAQWSTLRGRLAMMTDTGDLLQAIEPADVHLIQTQAASLRNTRLIVAGWLSLHPAAYVVSALLIAALLAAASTQLVKHLGRRNS